MRDFILPVEELVEAQRNEITEHFVYLKLAELVGGEDRKVLRKIAEEEMKHYRMFSEITGEEPEPDMRKVFFYTLLARVFGITFAIRLMERGEERVQVKYSKLVGRFPLLKEILEEERGHERELERIVEDELSRYLGSVILGLNDALVEMTGALAGLTFALSQNTLIGASSSVVGIAAALSMASSEYLSKRAEGTGDPVKAATYTGIAYILVVLLLVAPFFLLSNSLHSLLVSLSIAALLILLFSFYVSVVRERSFMSEFSTMLLMSAGVALVSFLIGSAVRYFFGIEV